MRGVNGRNAPPCGPASATWLTQSSEVTNGSDMGKKNSIWLRLDSLCNQYYLGNGRVRMTMLVIPMTTVVLLRLWKVFPVLLRMYSCVLVIFLVPGVFGPCSSPRRIMSVVRVAGLTALLVKSRKGNAIESLLYCSAMLIFEALSFLPYVKCDPGPLYYGVATHLIPTVQIQAARGATLLMLMGTLYCDAHGNVSSLLKSTPVYWQVAILKRILQWLREDGDIPALHAACVFLIVVRLHLRNGTRKQGDWGLTQQLIVACSSFFIIWKLSGWGDMLRATY